MRRHDLYRRSSKERDNLCASVGRQIGKRTLVPETDSQENGKDAFSLVGESVSPTSLPLGSTFSAVNKRAGGDSDRESFESCFPVAIDPAVARGAGDSILTAQLRC